MTAFPQFPAQARWCDTETGVFVYAAYDGARWWVLRLNDFPEHPLFTLFIDAARIRDIDDLPSAWGIGRGNVLPKLTAQGRGEVLRMMVGLGPYGSEVGRPCSGDWCTCDLLTDEYAAKPRPTNGD